MDMHRSDQNTTENANQNTYMKQNCRLYKLKLYETEMKLIWTVTKSNKTVTNMNCK